MRGPAGGTPVLPARLRGPVTRARLATSTPRRALPADAAYSPEGAKRLSLGRTHAATLAKVGLTPEQFASMTDEQVGTHASNYTQQKLMASKNAQVASAAAAFQPGWWDKLIAGFADMAVMAPYGTVKAVEHPGAAAHALKHSFGATITHPIRQLKNDPATFFVNTFGAASAGAGTVAKVGAVGDALAGAGRAGSFGDALSSLPAADRAAYDVLADPAKVKGGLDEHTVARIASPSEHLHAVLKHDPDLVARREGLLQALEGGKITVTPQGPVRAAVSAVQDAAATKAGRVAVAAIRTARPKGRTLTIPGAPGPEGEAAIDTLVQRLGSKNALVNAFQRHVVDARAQRRLDAGAVSSAPDGFHPQGFALDSNRNVTSLASSLGRNLDAERQVYERLAQAPAQSIERFGKTRAARLVGAVTRARVDKGAMLFPSRRGKLSLLEQKLVQIASSPGLQDDLHAAANLHSVYHAVHADRAAKTGDHETYAHQAAQFELARGAAKIAKEGPRPHVEQAIKEARALVGEREKLLPDEKLNDARALHRLGGQALELEYGAKGLTTPLQRLDALQKEHRAHGELSSTKSGARLVAFKKLLGKTEAAIAARGSHAHGDAVDELKAALADHVNTYGDLQDIFGTKGAQDAAEHGVELRDVGGRSVLKQGAEPPRHREFVGEPGRPGLTADLGGVPHTLETATARLAKIEGMREQMIDTIFKHLKQEHYPEGFGTKELKRETYLRNRQRSDPKAKSRGRSVEGRGHGGIHVPTLTEELRQEAERQFEATLAANKDHVEVQRIYANMAEAQRLRHAINVLTERQMFGHNEMAGDAAKTEQELLGHQHEGGPQLRMPGQQPSVRVEEHSTLPNLAESIPAARAKLAELEGARGANYGLSAQASMLKTEIEKLTSHARNGGKMQKLLELETTRKVREQGIMGIHRDLIAAGKVARDKGAFYLPMKGLHDVKRVVPEATHGRSEYGLSPGDLRTQSLSHAYKAALMRQGNFRVDATGLAADTYREAQKMAALRRGFEQMWSMSHETRDAAGGQYAVPIRATREVPGVLKRLIARADMGDLAPHDRALLNSVGSDGEKLREWFFPDPATIDARTNLSADNVPVRWVDGRTVSGLMRQQPKFVVRVRGKEFEPLAAMDIPNNILRGGLLYTKPAYILNLAQGIGMNAIQQGAFTPLNLSHALRLGRELGHDDQQAVFALMGEGLSRSLEPDAGPFQAGLHHAGEFWNQVVDRMPRAASWLHEARREGFVSPGQIHALLRDPRLQAKLVEVTRRANNEIIDYSMSPFEKAIVKRALFFYPWIRGSTLWSLRFPLEHPIQTAVYGNEAKQLGEPAYKKEIGQAPSYAESLIRVPGGRTINVAPLNSWQTAVDMGRGVVALAHPRDPRAATLFGELSPVAGALATILTGKTALGHDVPNDQSRVQAALSAMADSLPPLAFYQRLTSHDTTTNPARQHVYAGGLGTAAGKYGLGGMWPTPTNFDALHAKGKTEQIAAAGSRGALDIRYHDALTQLHESIPKLVAKGKLDAADGPRIFKLVSSAVALEHTRNVAFSDYASQAGKSVRDMTPDEKLVVELHVLAALPPNDPRHYDGADIIQRVTSGDLKGKITSSIASQFWTTRAASSAVLSTWKRYLSNVNEKYAGG